MLVSKAALAAGRTVAIYSLPKLLARIRRTYDAEAGQDSYLALFEVPDSSELPRQDRLESASPGRIGSLGRRPWQLIIRRSEVRVLPGPSLWKAICAAFRAGAWRRWATDWQLLLGQGCRRSDGAGHLATRGGRYCAGDVAGERGDRAAKVHQ